MTPEYYLDNNATSRPLPEVVEAMVRAMGAEFGNPSSANMAGKRGRRVLETARQNIAELLNAPSEAIHFTSGATESNNWLIQHWLNVHGGALVTTNTEHSSVKALVEYATVRGLEVRIVSVDETGLIPIDELQREIQDCHKPLVSVNWVNNETGVIQPVESIVDVCRECGASLHADAAQAFGKIPIDLAQLDVDYLSLSAHKLHGPQGVGALYVRDKARLGPLLLGGSQEAALRAGTENLPGIAGFGEAARLRSTTFAESIERVRAIRDKFEMLVGANIDDVAINGTTKSRVCNTSNLRFSGLDGQALVARLDQAGIRCSQSSACTNHRPEPSYVLRAMGLSEEEAYSSIRFTFSVLNSEAEIEQSVTILAELASQLRRFQRLHQSA